MPSERPLRRLEDILANVGRIERFMAGIHFAAFDADEQALYATLHALLIVSEAARKLGSEAHALAPGQPWDAIARFGNVLRHAYDGVDPHTVWRIIESGDLASLRDAVAAAVSRLHGDQTP